MKDNYDELSDEDFYIPNEYDEDGNRRMKPYSEIQKMLAEKAPAKTDENGFIILEGDFDYVGSYRNTSDFFGDVGTPTSPDDDFESMDYSPWEEKNGHHRGGYGM